MKNNFIHSSIRYITISCISLYRLIFYKRDSTTAEIFTINRDNTFSNSLIRVEYFFDNLIWINFPQIGKKLYNGNITLNSNRMIFPYEITVRTKGGIKKIIIQHEKVENSLQSDQYSVKGFSSFRRNYRNPNRFHFPKPTLKNLIFYQGPKFYFKKHTTEISKNIKINRINHIDFNTNDFI